MGILNITDDSFYDGGKYNKIDNWLRRADEMIIEGADFIDIGAQSSRPGAKELGFDEELKVLLPAVKSIRQNFPSAILSVDTWQSKVAEKIIDEGVDIINDISGGTFDNNMFNVVVKYQVPYIIMHTQGKPIVMQNNINYNDIVQDIIFFLSAQINKLNKLGLSDIIIDPGFGFAKTLEQNYQILNSLEHFLFLEAPILVGISRKSMIYKVLDTSAEKALAGTIALNTIALQKGADILRVHDVKEAKDSVNLFLKLKSVIK
ncbi:MAG: dihydropteroate synthase [Bacteroidetes bacterium CG2_30_33_31]|nr:MAG: dihydropteroate synthase [Bacteroidetes bacterium CG2_30_33_31]